MSAGPEDERFAFRKLSDEVKKPQNYIIPKELMDVIYNTLKFYGNQCSYEGERTGGVVAGCPRAPAPMPHELIRWANYALVRIDREVLHRE